MNIQGKRTAQKEGKLPAVNFRYHHFFVALEECSQIAREGVEVTDMGVGDRTAVCKRLRHTDRVQRMRSMPA